MKFVHKLGMLMVCLLTIAIVTGCEEDETTAPTSKAGTFTGDKVTIGADGSAESWVTLDEDGNPTAVGVTFSQAALAFLETDTLPQTFTMMMPNEASATPFDHVTFDWNPGGHPPPGIYTLPHIDVHFYMISQTDREEIKVVGDDTVRLFTHPEADGIPPDYSADPVGVPGMGVHWTDSTSGEFKGNGFDKTFIYGSFDGKMIFMEPMVTAKYLNDQNGGTYDIKQPTVYAIADRYYPTTYSIAYDADAETHTISMEGMTLR